MSSAARGYRIVGVTPPAAGTDLPANACSIGGPTARRGRRGPTPSTEVTRVRVSADSEPSPHQGRIAAAGWFVRALVAATGSGHLGSPASGRLLGVAGERPVGEPWAVGLLDHVDDPTVRGDGQRPLPQPEPHLRVGACSLGLRLDHRSGISVHLPRQEPVRHGLEPGPAVTHLGLPPHGSVALGRHTPRVPPICP
jgi:hypothetical protein